MHDNQEADHEEALQQNAEHDRRVRMWGALRQPSNPIPWPERPFSAENGFTYGGERTAERKHHK